MTLNQLIGIGLKHPHYQEIIEEKPPLGWLEVHSENFFDAGGASRDFLLKIRENYPLSMHGIGLSLGSAEGLSKSHLTSLKASINTFDPFLISEHLSWSVVKGKYIPDLLPLPYTKESFEIFRDNINLAQDFLKREILIENPSSYLEFQQADYHEASFLTELCVTTGAKILLDINNIFVSCHNHGWETTHYLNQIPGNLVKEIHLAGHETHKLSSGETLRIDTHSDVVCDEVWQLYGYTLEKMGPKHTLIEWDTKIPSLAVLLNEAEKAEAYFPKEKNCA